MIFQESLGLGVRSDGVGLCHVKNSFSGPRLVCHQFYKQDKKLPIEERLQAAAILVNDFIKERKLGGVDLYVGIPKDQVMFRLIELPAVVKENLRSTLTYEMEKYVPLPVSEILFDSIILQENKADNRIQVLLVVVKKRNFEPYLRFHHNMGNSLCGVVPLSIAFANGLVQIGANGRDETVLKTLIGEENGSFLFKQLDGKKRSHANITGFEEMVDFGLGVQALVELPFQVNFLPPENRKRPSRLKYFILVSLASLMLISLVIWVGTTILKQRLTLRTIENEIVRTASENDKIKAIRKEIEEKLEKLVFLRKLRQNQFAMIDILNELTEVIPTNAWVQQLTVKDSTVSIEGLAEKASELIQLLESSPIFEDVLFQSAITKDKTGKERFIIGLTLATEG